MKRPSKEVELSLLDYIHIIYSIEYLRVINIYFTFQSYRTICEQYNYISSFIMNINNFLLKLLSRSHVPSSFEPQDNININDNEQTTFLQKKRIKRKKLILKNTKCPHKSAKHYAKNMCSTCYHSKGRIKRAWKCPHIDSYHYALGLCRMCYQENYSKTKKSEDNSM